MKTKLILLLILNFAFLLDVHADSATWNLDPVSNDWNTTVNWTPATVPNGPSDIATFGLSHVTSVLVSATTEVNEIAFSSGASNFGITVDAPAVLTIGAGGVVNPGGTAESFLVQPGASLLLQSSSTLEGNLSYEIFGSPDSATVQGYMALLSANAGNGTYNLDGGESGSAFGALVQFHDASMGGNSTFNVNGGSAPFAYGAFLEFGGTDSFPTAGSGHFNIKGGTAAGAQGGFADVLFGTALETSTFTVFGGFIAGAAPGTLHIGAGATADQATLIALGAAPGADGGKIIFDHDSLGGSSRLQLSGKGNLDISSHDAPGLTIGSLEGDGVVFLGSQNLTVSSVKHSSLFAGGLRDGGSAGGTGGSFTKVGPGTLILTGASTHTGGTTISLGIVLVNNSRGSATGTGPVMVSRARLGGNGIIAGHVSVGSGGPLAVLGPGNITPDRLGHLTVQSSVFFSNSAVYEGELNSDEVDADLLTANRVTIASGATFTTADLGTSPLSSGTVLTIIGNTSAKPIAGTFTNLPDHSTMQIGSNTYEVSYEGGDGNDLTLTVVP